MPVRPCLPTGTTGRGKGLSLTFKGLKKENRWVSVSQSYRSRELWTVLHRNDKVKVLLGGGANVVTENTYWDATSSQHTDAVGGWPNGTPGTPDITSKTTAEMKTTAMVDALNDGNGPWTIDPTINDGYPSFTDGFASLPTENTTDITLTVYPTVFDGELQFESEAELKSYTVFAVSGKEIQKGGLNGNHAKINTQSITSGVYILLVNTNQGRISKKMVKE